MAVCVRQCGFRTQRARRNAHASAPAQLEVGACIQACGMGPGDSKHVMHPAPLQRTTLAHSLSIVRDGSLHLAVKQAQVTEQACRRQNSVQDLGPGSAQAHAPVLAAGQLPDACLPSSFLRTCNRGISAIAWELNVFKHALGGESRRGTLRCHAKTPCSGAAMTAQAPL